LVLLCDSWSANTAETTARQPPNFQGKEEIISDYFQTSVLHHT
jgi:hypothetical protein